MTHSLGLEVPFLVTLIPVAVHGVISLDNLRPEKIPFSVFQMNPLGFKGSTVQSV